MTHTRCFVTSLLFDIAKRLSAAERVLGSYLPPVKNMWHLVSWWHCHPICKWSSFTKHTVMVVVDFSLKLYLVQRGILFIKETFGCTRFRHTGRRWKTFFPNLLPRQAYPSGSDCLLLLAHCLSELLFALYCARAPWNACAFSLLEFIIGSHSSFRALRLTFGKRKPSVWAV